MNPFLKAAALTMLLTHIPSAWAQPDPALYRCTTIVTGTDNRSRPEGLARCLRQVAAKLAGDPAVADDPRLDTVAPASLVSDLVYLDRMSDIPQHDEQGSRDRPFDLVVQFDPARLDSVLAGLGRVPWLDRPALSVRVQVDNRGATTLLSADGAAGGQTGERQRRALLAAGERFGLHLVLPLVLPLDTPPSGEPRFQLGGTLRWSDTEYGWVGEWALYPPEQDRVPLATWSIRGVSFDEAFRSLVGGAAAVLSRP